MKIRFRCARDTDDPEKAVIPAVIFISCRHSHFKEYERGGFALALGWWDWSIRIAIFKERDGKAPGQ